MECECGGNVEFTVAKDMSSKIILIQAECANCGKTESGLGFSVEEVLEEIEETWQKKRKPIRRRQK